MDEFHNNKKMLTNLNYLMSLEKVIVLVQIISRKGNIVVKPLKVLTPMITHSFLHSKFTTEHTYHQ